MSNKGPYLGRTGLSIWTLALCLMASFFTGANAQDPQSLNLPKQVQSDWILSESATTYAPANLWQHINGAADQYLQYGCVALDVAYYHNSDKTAEIAVEVYTMKDTLSGFGIYAVQKPQQGPLLDIGVQGYEEANILNFYKGPYYVKLQGDQKNSATISGMKKLGSHIADSIQASKTVPPIFQVFPAEGLQENSFGFTPQGILGIRGLNNGFSARYHVQDQMVKLVLLREKDSPSAQQVLSVVNQSLSKRSSGPVTKLTFDDVQGFQGRDRYQGPLTVLVSGKDVFIFTGTADLDWIKVMIRNCVKKLKSLTTPEER